MSTSLHSLPVEILLLVADHLSLADNYQCSQVSRQWYRIFRPSLYRSVHINDPKTLGGFLKILCRDREKQEQHQPPSCTLYFPVSLCTKSIELSNVEFPKGIQDACPGVQSLAWRYDNPPKAVINQTMAYGAAITSLTLTYTASAQETPTDIFGLLRRMPQLQLLALSGVFKELSTDDLEDLYNEAPKTLTRLDLEGIILATDNHWVQSSSPSSSIRDLRLAYQWPDDERSSALWLMYLTYKYPRVRQLNLEGRKRTANVVSTSSRLSGYGGDEQDNMEFQAMDPLNLQACGVFSRYHPELEHIRLMNIGLHSSLYRIMLQGLQQCKHVDLAGVEAPSSYTSEQKQQWLEDLFSSFQERVQQLDMNMVYPRSVMAGLSRCKNLRELTIGRTSGFFTSRDPHWQLPLSDLLAICPRLEQLTLRRLTIGSPLTTAHLQQHITKSRRHHPLRSLRLEYAALPASILQALAVQCPRLNKLYVHHCKWMSQNHRRNDVIVHMPEQMLDLVEIIGSGDVYTLEPHSLLAIKTVNAPTDGYRWLFSAESSATTCSTTTQSIMQQASAWSQIQSLSSMQRLMHLNEQNVALLEKHMSDLEVACALRISSKEQTASDGLCTRIKTALSHGYLAFQCKSINNFYFNGARVNL
ncbi:hypothetical protein BDB00DRAFT_813773 [Zychaea mexicana]|uniref:uncharacterized protein n=1 Tax=Zychaea mexicana TaxID=64656 RepID=UPI0022FE9E04|nr:uncharacterized protein BDB00DRAFT_813773 [Zychaea mexicana]KAI9495545.1 hypothetical protein BDB00DRAFT_813773 [Zychaea mexicana]